MGSFSVYIIRCAGGKYYVGHSKNITERFKRHMQKTGSRFTLQNKPERIVWSQVFDTELEAIERERQVKGWTRVKKEKLINKVWK